MRQQTYEEALKAVVAEEERMLHAVGEITAEGPRNRDRMQRVIALLLDGHKKVILLASEALK